MYVLILILYFDLYFPPVELMSEAGFKNPPSVDGILNEPEAIKNLIKLGIEDLNMFGKPLFLHSGPLIKLSTPDKVPKVKVGGTLQKLDLEETKMPATSMSQGLIVVALDPLWKIPDADRIDNVFVQYINLGNGETLESEDKMCNVIGLGSSTG